MLVTLKHKVGNKAPILIYARHELIKMSFSSFEGSSSSGMCSEVVYEILDHEAPNVEHITKEWWETLIVYFNEKCELVCEVVTLVDHLEEKIKGEFKFYSPNLIAEGEKYGIDRS